MRTHRKPERRVRWLLLAAAALWLALAPPDAAGGFQTTTQRFLCYFSGLKNTGQPLSLWDRLAISLVLAGRQEARPRSGGGEPAS